jgi:hypothetical protein
MKLPILSVDPIESAIVEARNDNHPVVDMGVASNCRERGDKRLVERTLTSRDFPGPDRYTTVPLGFEVLADAGEREVDFRLFTHGSGHLMMLDHHIRLSMKSL